MPWHLAIDQASERRLGKLQIGTTRRGIGPTYADKAYRLGIRLQDLFDPKILRQKIEVALAEKNVWLERVYGVEPIELEELAGRYESYAQRLRPYLADTSLLVDRALRDGKRVLLEGAHGTLLDIDHGTYPFVTSSPTLAGGATTGIGIGPTRIDAVLGVAKAYVTRVGDGPFPTEIDGPDQERVRELGGEFGTVTGRERRCGWLDLVALRYAVRLNGITSLALTKLDVLSAFGELPVCTRYRAARRRGDRRVPGAPERLPPLPAGLRGAARAGVSRSDERDCPTRRGATSSSSSRSSTSRSRGSAPAPSASRCWRAASRLRVERHRAVVADRPVRVVGDLPRVAVRIDEDSRVAAPERLGAGAVRSSLPQSPRRRAQRRPPPGSARCAPA